jgi:hypothetical protein
VIVPDEIDPNGEFAWLLYEGRWGERQAGPFNGVVGPSFNSRWIDPWETTDNWRNFSIVVPEPDSTLGPTMTETFCNLVESGSQVLIFAKVYPWATLPAIGLVIAVFVFFYRRSRYLLHGALRLYRAHWKVFVGIGLAAVPIGIAFNLLQSFLINRDPLRFVVRWFDDTTGARLSAVTAVGGVQQLAMLLIIGPAVIQAVADIHRGQSPGVVRSYETAAKRALPIAIAVIIMVVLVGIPLLTVIGIPVAIWLLVKWQFMAHILVFDTSQSSVHALEESSRLVKGRWWKTLFAVIIFDLLAVIPGFLVGFGLLTLGRTAVGFANSASSLLYALTIPIAVIAVTLMYLDRRGEPLPAPAAPAAPAQEMGNAPAPAGD